MPAPLQFQVATEFGRLTHVILGTGEGYHRDPAQVEVINATHAATLQAVGHPDPDHVTRDFARVRAALEAAGVRVCQPGLAPDSVQDQTCPRDIGFVIGTTFVTAGMRSPGRAEEIAGIRHILADWSGPQITVPRGIALEGGDVVVDGDLVFAGIGQRSDAAGAEFLAQHFAATHRIVPLPTTPPDQGEDVLHLDCTFQPLGLGHALIHPAGLVDIPPEIHDRYHWIEVDRTEAAALATNILSLAPDHILARTHPACARVNATMRAAGYRVTEVDFDAVPSTGGAFRCATLPLHRA